MEHETITCPRRVRRPAAILLVVLAAGCPQGADPRGRDAAARVLATATPCERDRQAADVDLDGAAIAIAAGEDRACAVLADRSVTCWGDTVPERIAQELFEGTAPTRVRGVSDVVELALGDHAGCARGRSGTVQCWGFDGAIRRRVARSKGPTSGTVAVGVDHVCVAHDGGAWCVGELVPFGTFPGWSRVRGISGVSRVATGAGFGCAIGAEGEVACWGEYHNAEGTPIRAVRVPALGKAQSLALSGGDRCALHPTGTVTCLRPDQNEQLVPVTIRNLDDARAIDVHDRGGCAVRATGGVACWRSDRGWASAGDTIVAEDVPGVGDAIEVAVGDRFACILRAGGRVRCWGENDVRQLGIETFLRSEEPRTVCGLDRVTHVAEGSGHVCALRDDGAVYCWGENSKGQLGAGTAPSAVPIRVAGSDRTVQVVAYHDATCALDATGLVRCWGDNPLAGTIRESEFAVPRGPVAAIALGSAGLCAIEPDRAVTCNGRTVPGVARAGRIVGGDIMCADVDDARGRRAVCWHAYFWRGDDSTGRRVMDPVDLVSCDGELCGVHGGEVVCRNRRHARDPGTCTPRDPDTLELAVDQEGRGEPSCAVTASGLVTCVGYNGEGQLGIGLFGHLPTPGLAPTSP